MMKYSEYNADGISIHKNRGTDYYYNTPQTLQLLHKIGGVCGACTGFAVAMCRSFGVPIFGVAQPGHSAFVWYNYVTKVWVGGFFHSGWDKTTNNAGWYAERNVVPEWLPMMNELQGERNKNFRLSDYPRRWG